MQYVLNLPLSVLACGDNHQAAVTVPAGTVIEVVGPMEHDDRFVLIKVNAGQFHIFASDLSDRAEPVVARGDVRGFSEESPARVSTRAKG